MYLLKLQKRGNRRRFYEKALDIADKIQDTIDEIQATYEKAA